MCPHNCLLTYFTRCCAQIAWQWRNISQRNQTNLPPRQTKQRNLHHGLDLAFLNTLYPIAKQTYGNSPLNSEMKTLKFTWHSAYPDNGTMKNMWWTLWVLLVSTVVTGLELTQRLFSIYQIQSPTHGWRQAKKRVSDQDLLSSCPEFLTFQYSFLLPH